MPDAGAEDDRTGGEGESPQILRAKYHDYCSAQLAELLMYLSADEIYLLAQKAASEKGSPDRTSYAEMVAGATEWLSHQIALPPFEVWLEDYRKHPQHYEEYFMGLWESELGVRSDG